jgi:hypothetical protein
MFTYLVGWHAGPVSLSPSDVILAQLDLTLSDIMFWLHSGITNLSLYKHWFKYRLELWPPGACVIKILFTTVNYSSNFNPTFLRLKSHINLPSYYSNLPPFQGKFNVIKITTVINPKIAVNYRGICFITQAPDVSNKSKCWYSNY